MLSNSRSTWYRAYLNRNVSGYRFTLRVANDGSRRAGSLFPTIFLAREQMLQMRQYTRDIQKAESSIFSSRTGKVQDASDISISTACEINSL